MKILDRLPILPDRASLRFGDRYVTVHRDQVLVWVSVHLSGVLEPEGNIPRFPALLDTGNNLGFAVQERHLRDWAGIRHDLLEPLREINVNGQVVGLRKATVWLCSNVPGRQDASPERWPLRLEMRRGIAVYPPDPGPAGPRLPLLGLPALLENGLDCWLDPDRRHITVQTASWRRRIMRLLCRL
jgi:hypothetical protein